VERLTARSQRKTGRNSAQIVGLVSPATHVGDPTLIGPIRELESQIAERANWLADDVVANPPDWYRALCRTVSTKSNCDLAELARVVAAYRERYQIHGHSILGDTPPSHAVERRRHHSRLMNTLIGFSAEAAQ
jgi:hypothetical protein